MGCDIYDRHPTAAHAAIAVAYRREHGRVLASLLRTLNGDFELAEEALMDACATALQRWNVDGVPDNPAAWLTVTARRKALDRIRRRGTVRDKAGAVETLIRLNAEEAMLDARHTIPDERLRLLFTCCHPALPLEARVALTLRALGGLTTPAIASAFLVPPATMAQRLVRAKRRIRDGGIPYTVPEPDELAERIDGVLRVIYLIFTEGHNASQGASLVRVDLCEEAIRLARAVVDLMPGAAEVEGLLALLVLTDSRRDARVVDGELVTLDEQDRGRWDAEAIEEGRLLIRRALLRRAVGPYQVQAAIAALHAEAATAAETDWPQIAELYALLESMWPTPIVRLNRAVAVAMVEGPEVGLASLDAPETAAALNNYRLQHAARADLLRRAGRKEEAAAAYREALARTEGEPERRFLERRLAQVATTDAQG
ncbi:MAG: RNA polymerase sigma-70 factor (ECF subfamily) [Myxococcota bacterium]